jgi:hypothetical protein
MFTATLTTLAAAAALSAQTVTANGPASPTTVVAPAAVSAPATTAISTPAKPAPRPAVRIPGTFDVSPDQDPLEGLHALYIVRAGDA